ncbi:MAG: FHA domain-containing protein [Thermoguttaceae bacterium]
MKLKLIELNPLGHNRKVVLDKLPAVLGRSSSSQILVADQWVSRRHCELNEVDGVLVVRDLGSRHGTYVNGMRVSEAATPARRQTHRGLDEVRGQLSGGRPARLAPPIVSPPDR